MQALVRVDVPRRVAVLGTMAELGEDAALAHREIAELASSLGVDVVAVDEPRYGDGVVHVGDAAAAADYLASLDAPLAVLVKGSTGRGVGAGRRAARLRPLGPVGEILGPVGGKQGPVGGDEGPVGD
ncbi:hypothetical protein [Gordonia crocea]|uniref:Uncharacterized protein n=1 Tax=Gordonia crocea TaxID=589162 RepID=A0A7I9UZP4_9ACTN|nr:hypothetical protein [Gordonia crocea]GED98654.1 hypothetical protein nbrc107697_26930 [Gordonia crocea]